MVATRNRVTALVFVGLLMLSSLAVITPTASAQVSVPQTTFTSIVLTKINNQTFPGATYPDTYVIRPGDTLKFRIDGTVSCIPTSGVPSGTATLTTVGILNRTAGAPTAMTRDPPDGNAFFALIDVTVQGDFTGTDGRESLGKDQTFSGAIIGTCDGALDSQPATGTSTPPVSIDNRAPRVPAAKYAWFNATGLDGAFPRHADVSNAASSATMPVGAGSLVMLKDFYTDASPMGAGSVDTTKFGWGTAPLLLNAGNQTFNFTVLDEDQLAPAHEYNNVTVADNAITVSDIYGNVGTGTYSVRVDNVRPTGALHAWIATDHGRLVRTNTTRTSQGITATNATTVSVTWNESVVGGGVTPETNDVVGAFVFANGVAKSFTTNGSQTMFSVTESLADPLAITYYPVDAGGNVGRTATAIPFPHMDLRYGLGDPLETQHPKFIGGSLIGPVYLNVTSNVAPMEREPIGARLVRYTDLGAREYWKVGTAGAAGDFTGTAGPDTLVKPVSATPTNIILVNFSNRAGSGNARNYVDGRYELSVSASGPFANATYEYAFRIDGAPPALNPMKNWTAGPDTANTTGAANQHGLDGNPFRVAMNATEWRGSSRDSGLRNVSVELVSQDLSSVVRLANGSLARLEFTLEQCGVDGPFSHCHNLDDRDPTKYAVGSPERARAERNLAVWNAVVRDDQWNTTANATWFNGWFNTTFPGAPVGAHKIRVLAYDQAGAPTALVYGSGASTDTYYKVVPRVAVHSSVGTPFIEGDQLTVTALAAQDLHVESVPGGMVCVAGSAPTARVCPADFVRILVSNSNAVASNAGTIITATPFVHQDASTSTVPYLTWSFTNRSANGTGWLDHAALRSWDLFQFTPVSPLTIPSTIDRTKDIYVRAEAYRVVGGAEADVGRSQWVKATVGAVSDIVMRAPGQDWSVNRNGSIPLNITFDRKTNPSADVLMQFEIYGTTDGGFTQVYSSTPRGPDLLAGNVAPKYKLNWTATIQDHNRAGANKSLSPGTYLLKAYVNETGAPLGELWRNFTVLPGDPYVVVDDTQVSGAIAAVAPGIYHVRSRFDLAVSANHSFANVTSVDQLTFTLERGTKLTCTFAGGAPQCPPNTGFTVTRVNSSPLLPSRQSSHWNFTITMPTTAANRDAFTLNITAATDGFERTPGAPWNLTHASVFPRLTYDADKPTGEVQLQLTNATGSLDAPKFALTGTVEHSGSGLPVIGVLVQDVDASGDPYLSFEGASVTLASTAGSATAASSELRAALGKAIRQVEVVRRNATLVDWTLRAADRPVYGTTGVLQERMYFPDFTLPATHNLTVTVSVDGVAQAPFTTAFNPLVPANASAGAANVVQVQDPSRSSAIAIAGFAQDLGSGVRTVQVRLIDNSTGSTYVFPGADVTQSVGRVTDDWATSDAIDLSVRDAAGAVTESRWIKQIELNRRSATSSQWEWYLRTGERPVLALQADGTYTPTGLFWRDFELSRTTEYRVQVRVTDRLGQVSDPVREFKVQFDPSGPSLLSPITGPTLIDWHAKPNEATLSVQATDNYCLKRVTLKGTAPSGANVSANMVKTGGPECSLAGRATTWSLALSTAPNMTDEIGEYLYWYEAEDHAGHVTAVPVVERSFRARIRDNWPAEVKFTPTFDPPVAGAGLPVRVTAEIVENQAIARVEIIVRNGTTNAIIANGTMQPDPQRPVGSTGSGYYVADLAADLDLTLEIGTYLVEVRPYDVNWNRTAAPGPTCQLVCPSKFANLRVIEEDSPIIRLDSPVGTSVVNGTPTFRFSVLHRGIASNGIQLRAGPAGNLTAVTPTLTEIKTAANVSQGWQGVFAPGTLAEQANYTLQVTATSARTGFTNASTFTFSVDAAPPVVNAATTGTTSVANTTYAVAATRVNLTATDNLTGPPVVKYSVNNGAEQTYSAPISPSGDDGLWTLQYWAVDGAGNAAAKQTLTLTLDKTGPRITVAQHGDEVTLTVTDAGVGLDETNVTVNYAYGEAVSFSAQKAVKGTGNLFTATLPGRASETGLRYWFSARDLLGNVGTNYSAAAPYVIKRNDTTQPPQNVPPTISITAPVAGAEVNGTLELRWLAEDPEGAPLTVSITVRDPAPGSLLVPAGENTGLYRVNLASYAPGEYTIVVTANDGERSASDEVTFRVGGTPPPPVNPIAIEQPPPATVEPGQPATFAVKINATGRQVAQATYRIVRGNTTVTSGQLALANGAYGGTYTPTEPGDYRIVVDVLYADGGTARREAGVFNVPGDGEGPETRPVFPVSLMTLAALAVVVIALAAYGAFGRWKK